MRSSVLWLIWLVLPVFVLAFHYGPGQIWLARDHASEFIRAAQARAVEADAAQEAAYEAQLRVLQARRDAFLADVDWQTQPEHPLAVTIQTTLEQQAIAYEAAAEKWNTTAELFGQATDALLDAMESSLSKDAPLSKTDRQLLESLRWAEARAMVRGGYVFNGIDQLQALLDLRLAETQRSQSARVRPASSSSMGEAGPSESPASKSTTAGVLPIEAIREELAAAQYIGARLLREEGRAPEVWRPIANQARQQYRFLADHEEAVVRSNTAASSGAPENAAMPEGRSLPTRNEQIQRNLEQVLNLEQSSSDQLEGIPLPRRAPLARRPGDGEPGDRPGNRPGRGPLQDGPPGQGAGIPGPYGSGW